MDALHARNSQFRNSGLYDDEYVRDFKRPEPAGSRLRQTRLLNMVRNVGSLRTSRLSMLGRRSLSHLLLHLRRGAK